MSIRAKKIPESTQEWVKFKAETDQKIEDLESEMKSIEGLVTELETLTSKLKSEQDAVLVSQSSLLHALGSERIKNPRTAANLDRFYEGLAVEMQLKYPNVATELLDLRSEESMKADPTQTAADPAEKKS